MNLTRVIFTTAQLVVLLLGGVMCGIDSVVFKLRDAIAGSNDYHKKQKWEFDPNVAARRRPEFEALHGHHSEILIEKFGLGKDGRMEQRRQEQAIRDIGVPITSFTGITTG
ncbi:unnamed protein product [Bemisia tabaci]|uniref:Uncharacterized protein n=1 Tax=Bemisia tabaci TaxID=7038 RepID=A0A9P0CGT2_BEMTA|nr:unnamed protein product [Bemisia tabaci]